MTNELNYASPAISEKRSREERVYLALLKCLIGYFLACSATVPFMNALWLGELPLLALPQVPKTSWANWLRVEAVIPAIRLLGLSKGSYSPDWSNAGPWALAIAYLTVPGLLICLVCVRMGMKGRYRKWIAILAAVALVDYVMTLTFARGPGLSIY